MSEQEAEDSISEQGNAPKVTHDEWIKTFDPDNEHLGRFAFLADGIFAIALTLLAIELHAPEHWDGTIAGLGKELLAGLRAYLIAFVILAAVWADFRRHTALLVSIDKVVIILGTAQLFFVGLTPPAVGLVTNHGDKPLSGMLYLSVFLGLYTSSTLFWWYIAHHKELIRPDLPADYRRSHLWQRLSVLGAMVFLVPLMASGGNWADLSLGGKLSLAASVVFIFLSFRLRKRLQTSFYASVS